MLQFAVNQWAADDDEVVLARRCDVDPSSSDLMLGAEFLPKWENIAASNM
jgi:hypothetical protein